MKTSILESLRLKLLFVTIGPLFLAAMAVAEDDWGADLEIYAWLPIIQMESDGWRYLHYDIGSNTALSELNLNGPYVGAIFRW